MDLATATKEVLRLVENACEIDCEAVALTEMDSKWIAWVIDNLTGDWWTATVSKDQVSDCKRFTDKQLAAWSFVYKMGAACSDEHNSA